MSKRNTGAVRLLFVPVMVAALATFSLSCAPGISMERNNGFKHLSSASVPFKPGDSTRLYIDDEGTAVLLRLIETVQGHVNPLREFSLELYRIKSLGNTETSKFGPFDVGVLARDRRLLAIAKDDEVTYFDMTNSDSKRVVDGDLADMLRRGSTYSNGIAVCTVPVPEKPGLERGLVIYDTSTRKKIDVDLQEEYVDIEVMDIDSENILIKASMDDNRPYTVYYVLGLDGIHKLRMGMHYPVDDAILVPEGMIICRTELFVVNTVKATSKVNRATLLLEKYSFSGELLWSKSISHKGVPSLQLLTGQRKNILALTLIDRNEATGFIGYFTIDDGKQFYARTFDNEYGIWPLDDAASYYTYPQWSLYSLIPPQAGSVSLFRGDNELATIDFGEGLYWFAASPSGRFFAVVTDGNVSIFSREE